MKILVVDDENDVKILFEQRFRKEIRNGDVTLIFASNGFDALDVLDNNRQDIPLILSDINMPGMTGIDLLKKIKTSYQAPSPDVIMITAYGDQENYDRCKSLGADDLLPKPLDFSLLKEIIAGRLSNNNLS
jgi:two-component system, chemotaxis family, chemotaxis protein CheY